MEHVRTMYRIGLSGLALCLVMACQSNDNQANQHASLPPEAQWSDEAWAADTLDWRTRRLNRLTLPDGYLALAGLDFLTTGRSTVGQSTESDLVMPDGPDRWGQLVLTDSSAWFVPALDSGIDVLHPHPDKTDPPVPGAIKLAVAGGDLEPSRISHGQTHFYMAIRKGEWVARTRDPNSSARANFVGLDYYPLNRDFQVVGQFEPHPPGTTIPTATVLGELIDEPNPGRVVFELGGETYSLEAIAAASGEEFFFILADRTSGSETYGLGRFLYSSLPNQAGQVVLDFNRTYNPPCAFNAYTTCPLPPPSNRINFPIRAGELKYRGVAGQDPDQLP